MGRMPLNAPRSERSSPGTISIRRGRDQRTAFAIAWHQKHYNGLDFSPENEILVTTARPKPLRAVSLVTVRDRRRVVMFEPYYDSYAACTAMAGAQRRVVQLQALSGRLTRTPLRARSPIGLGSYW